MVALAAGAAISAAYAGSDVADPDAREERVALLASENPPTVHETLPESLITLTPSPPLSSASDAEEAGESKPHPEPNPIAVLQKGTELNYQRELAEEEARRPTVALPTVGVPTSPFGPRWDASHGGLDLANTVGTPIFAATDGVVIDSGPASGFGKWIRIMSPDGVMTVYGHNEVNGVEVGESVVAGQQIGEMGNRGFSTGPHLHFEVWIEDGSQSVDPAVWLAGHGLPIDEASSSAS